MSEILFLGVGLLTQLSAALPATSHCPSKPTQVLRFKQLDGFRVHRESDSRKGQHLRIQSNTSGLLRISKKSYTASKRRKGNQMLNPTMSIPLGFDPVDIPDPTDHLPDCVDLSILNDKRRPCLISVSGSGLCTLSRT